jgi:hypothetical protein
MSEPIKPALTPEEWARKRAERPQPKEPGYVVVTPYVEDRHWGISVSSHYSNASVNKDLRHALAALCLHGQAYGFTREDVAALERVQLEVGGLQSLIDRLEALLPPEEP